MNHFNRDRVIGMVSGVGFAGLLFGAFAFGWWSRGSQLVAVGPTVISAPPAAVAAPAPDLSSPDVMAADFERRHPPLAIPAVFEKSVLFQLGLTQFAPGDSITITDIRGTSDSFAPGSVYQIKGTYTLASH
jgi:hypothetical protein